MDIRDAHSLDFSPEQRAAMAAEGACLVNFWPAPGRFRSDLCSRAATYSRARHPAVVLVSCPFCFCCMVLWGTSMAQAMSSFSRNVVRESPPHLPACLPTPRNNKLRPQAARLRGGVPVAPAGGLPAQLRRLPQHAPAPGRTSMGVGKRSQGKAVCGNLRQANGVFRNPS